MRFTLFTRPRLLAGLVLLGAATTKTVAAQNAAVLTTVRTDTFSVELHACHGNVVTGSWVVLHAPGVYVHDYRITLGADGLPAHYSMKYRVPVSLDENRRPSTPWWSTTIVTRSPTRSCNATRLSPARSRCMKPFPSSANP